MMYFVVSQCQNPETCINMINDTFSATEIFHEKVNDSACLGIPPNARCQQSLFALNRFNNRPER